MATEINKLVVPIPDGQGGYVNEEITFEGSGGSGLPDEVITYEQFRAKSDSEQLAYTGYVTGWPGSGGGSGSGGHTIINESGTSLAQEPNLQFKGADVSDDSTNNRTVVDMSYTEIDYEDWLELTEQEKETGRWDVVGVPGSDGTVSFDLMTKLWENPDPTQTMTAGTEININDTDYDLIAYVCFYTSSNNRVIPLLLAPKNKSVYACYTDSTNTKQRRFDHSDGKVTLQSGYVGSAVDNTAVIPYQIYGIKTSQTVEIKAIAPEVSTSASKCMMSDGETSVEEAIEEVDDKVKISDVTITKNTSDWSANNTRVERFGRLIVAHISFSGVPVNNKVIATGLPAPRYQIDDYEAPMGVMNLGTNGVLKITSAGTTSSAICYYTLVYISAS